VGTIQYRDKLSSATVKLTNAQALQDLCLQYNASLIINDDIELALTVGAAEYTLLDKTMAAFAMRERSSAPKPSSARPVTTALNLPPDGDAHASYLAFGRFFPR
jgi:thiamine-phosphate pyrophosphorylase